MFFSKQNISSGVIVLKFSLSCNDTNACTLRKVNLIWVGFFLPGAGPKYYKWAKGAQIRGNLDVLESWAAEHGLQGEATQFLQKLSGTADLLATPKVQLIQVIYKDFIQCL